MMGSLSNSSIHRLSNINLHYSTCLIVLNSSLVSWPRLLFDSRSRSRVQRITALSKYSQRRSLTISGLSSLPSRSHPVECNTTPIYPEHCRSRLPVLECSRIRRRRSGSTRHHDDTIHSTPTEVTCLDISIYRLSQSKHSAFLGHRVSFY